MHDFSIECELFRHGLQQLQHAHILHQAHDVDRHQYAQIKAFVGNRLRRAVALLQAQLAQYRRAWDLGHQPGTLGACISNDSAALGEERRFLHPGLFAQHIERADMLDGRSYCERYRHRFGFLGEIFQKIVECVTAEIEAPFKRLLDAHIEPRLDAFSDKLNRYAIHERSRQHGHQREQQHQPQRELGAEYPGLEFLPQRIQLVGEQKREAHRESAVECKQYRVVLCKQRRVCARRRQQVERHSAHYGAYDQQILGDATLQHWPDAGHIEHHGVTLQRCHSEPKFQSREASALS